MLWRHSKRFIRRVAGLHLRPLTDYSSIPPHRIRNFSIIAHVDHGKSTLADRLIDLGGTRSTELPQQLDSLQVERERGITVKAQCASLQFRKDGEVYLLNLIDTPGHADFSHEVGKSLFVSDGAILLVDATQGVQAQTVSNFYTAFEKDLSIIGAVNKIDMPGAKVAACRDEMGMMFDLGGDIIRDISAKTGQGVEDVIPLIIDHVPPPSGHPDSDFSAILHDCQYLPTRGHVIVTILVKSGSLSTRDPIHLLGTGVTYPVWELGVFLPALCRTESLSVGQMGYMLLKVRDVRDISIGDTICKPGYPVQLLKSLPQPKPSIFSGLFPDEETDFSELKESLEKMVRSDTSVSVLPDSHPNLGRGWRLGYLGTLHREVFGQRLLQEFGTRIVMTKPNITYRCLLRTGEHKEFNSADDMPESCFVRGWEEPVVLATLIFPESCLEAVLSHCLACRGRERENGILGEGRFLLKYEIPLSETVTDFYSRIKQVSSGYASVDLEEAGWWETDLVKVDVLVNGGKVEGLSTVVRSEVVREYSREVVAEVKKEIARELYKITIQCAVGNKIMAREDIAPVRKDVTSHLYGGDKTRAMKLLKQQAVGKKQLKEKAVIKIPKSLFRRI